MCFLIGYVGLRVVPASQPARALSPVTLGRCAFTRPDARDESALHWYNRLEIRALPAHGGGAALPFEIAALAIIDHPGLEKVRFAREIGERR